MHTIDLRPTGPRSTDLYIAGTFVATGSSDEDAQLLGEAVILACHYAARSPRDGEEPTGAATINGSAVPFVAEAAYRKAIAYDRRNSDYALSLGGTCVGWARTPGDGETVLDALLAEIVRRVLWGGEVFAEVIADYYGDAIEDDGATNAMLWGETVRAYEGG